MTHEHRVIDLGICDAGTDEQSAYEIHVDLLAKQVRSLYCICVREFTGDAEYGTQPMPQWDGDPDGDSGRRSKNVWPKIARKIIAQQADPFHYVRAQFHASKLAKPPHPNTFYNDTAVQKYELFKLQARKDLEYRVASDVNQIKIHVLPFTVNLKWPPARALDYALRDPKCGASPLVRYCFAVEAALPVAAALRERALAQYMFQMSDYDDVLQNRIPEELRADAHAYHQRFVGRD